MMTINYSQATLKRGVEFPGMSLAVISALLLALSWLPEAHAAGLCSRTAKVAFHGCRDDVSDDYWIELGGCYNESNPAERSQCYKDASSERSEGRAECLAQRGVRNEVCELLGPDAYDPQVEPADFLSPAETAAAPNQYFPLIPGTFWRYEAQDEVIEVEVTHETIEILRVTCIVVRDVVSENGVLVEDTFDWYAQDRAGNVWYFGEIAKNFENGLLTDIDGSWKAGEKHAKPGIIMKAFLQQGDVYRQEFQLAEAEDMGEVLSLTGSAQTPGGFCDGDCLITKDYTPITPGAVEHRYYALGVGLILEVDPDSGDRVELVEVVFP